MKSPTLPGGKSWCASLVLATILTGCSTPSSVNWDKQIGSYTWEEALTDLGTPDEVTNQPGGVKTAVWSKERSVGLGQAEAPPSYLRGEPANLDQAYGRTAPPKVLRLSFTPDGKLFDWSRNY